MVEELWCHAVRFLDMYRTGDHSGHIGQLYQFEDQTGILETHKQCLAQPYEDSQVDMKIMYYELIRMMTNYERENCKDPELYDSTKSVGKIEGYQELTNKLQRFLNQRFILDIEELNKKHAGDNIAINGDENIIQKIGDLEKSFEVLAENNKILSESCVSLESTNKVLEHEIGKLKEKILQTEDLKEAPIIKDVEFVSNLNEHPIESDSDEAMDSEFSVSLLFQKIEIQNEAIAKLDDKMHKMINQANTLLINDATHLERISNLETQGLEFTGKLSNLESADLYLQESHRMVTERTNLAEKYSKYVEEKVNLLTNQKQEEILSKPNNHHSFNLKQEELENRFNVLENSVLDLQNNRNIQEEIVAIKDKLKVGTVLNNIQNTNTTKITEIQRKEEISKIKTKESNKNFYLSDTGKNENSSNYIELVEQYKIILGKVEKMEILLGRQAQSLANYSELFSEEYLKVVAANVNKSNERESTKIFKETISELKSEKLETSTHLEIHSKEFLDENMARDVIVIKAEVENIKRQLQLYFQNHNESSIRMANFENDLLEIFRKSDSNSSIFEFIEILVGMNKSLNQMMEDFVNSQAQLHLLRNEQEEVFNKIGEQKQIIESHANRFDNISTKIEASDIKEICDYELICERTQDMENNIAVMKEKIDELEKIRNSQRSAGTAKEEDFTVDTNVSKEEPESRGLNSPKRPGSNRWLANWFAKQHGTICC
eukprot:GFUD01023080.1.p1 GENE.GFUD01023080.1~~GFUD01023080.1.p1  ORF type:complete len:719 (-),score=237.45 GFUD01023080.1:177-2333(-)